MKKIIVSVIFFPIIWVSCPVYANNKTQHFILNVQYDQAYGVITCFRSEDSLLATCDHPLRGQMQAIHTYQHGPKNWRLSTKGEIYYVVVPAPDGSGTFILQPAERKVDLSLSLECAVFFNQFQSTENENGTLEIFSHASVDDPCKQDVMCSHPVKVTYSRCMTVWTPSHA